MKHLVIAVSPDSSLELLAAYADIVVLDKHPMLDGMMGYDTVYIRSHFGQASTLPQNFRSEIDHIVQRVKQLNPAVTFVDGMRDVDEIINFEDKWHQYELFRNRMPHTELLDSADAGSFERPLFKKRLSSRGRGVTWDKASAVPAEDWIVQESLNIKEELRIYVVCGEVYPVGSVRQSMTARRQAQVIGVRDLTQHEIDFATTIAKQAPGLDMIGLDVALTATGQLCLMEVNRSPGFAKFHQLTGINLAEALYTRL
jgi:hypothetical protein